MKVLKWLFSTKSVNTELFSYKPTFIKLIARIVVLVCLLLLGRFYPQPESRKIVLSLVYIAIMYMFALLMYTLGEFGLTKENRHSGKVAFAFETILIWLERADSIAVKFIYQEEPILVEKYLPEKADSGTGIIYSLKNMTKNTQAKFNDYAEFKEHFY